MSILPIVKQHRSQIESGARLHAIDRAKGFNAADGAPRYLQRGSIAERYVELNIGHEKQMSQKPISRLTAVSQPPERSKPTMSPANTANTQDNDIDIFRFLGVLWRGKWTIFLCTLLAIVLGGVLRISGGKTKVLGDDDTGIATKKPTSC